MSRSAKDLEIPRYYRDPQTRKYFRKPNYGISRVSDEYTSNNHEASYSTARNLLQRSKSPVLRSSNILDCVANNQNGSSLSHVFQDDILGFKVQNLKPKKIVPFPDCDGTVNVRMLKGGDTALYGQWVKSMTGLSYIFAFENSKKFKIPSELRCDEMSLVTFPPHVTISDFCELKSQNPLSLLMVGNDFQTLTAMAYFNVRLVDANNIGILRKFKLGSLVWCCCTNSCNDDFAVGVEKGICVKSPYCDLYFKKLQGPVYSISFNKKGNVIYAGLKTGHVIITDTRAGAKEYEIIKLHNFELVDETVTLEDERYLMCGGLDNMLCKMDLRMERVAVNYSGDVRSALKIPISINETFNLLCSTGTDNVTRLWSLSSGKLLRSICPPVPGPDCRSWLTDDSSKCSLYIAQQKRMYFYEF